MHAKDAPSNATAAVGVAVAEISSADKSPSLLISDTPPQTLFKDKKKPSLSRSSKSPASPLSKSTKQMSEKGKYNITSLIAAQIYE